MKQGNPENTNRGSNKQTELQTKTIARTNHGDKKKSENLIIARKFRLTNTRAIINTRPSKNPEDRKKYNIKV